MGLAGCLAGSWLLVLLALNCPTLGDTENVVLEYPLPQEPDVPFPLAYPSAQNIDAICKNGEYRRRYPPSYFPPSGYSHFRRRGKAINCLESWYNMCCHGNVPQDNNQNVCCAQQAWHQALSQFCEDEFSVKTVAYPCCRVKGDKRWICFDTNVVGSYQAFPGYQAPAQLTQEPGFIWNPDQCLHE
ncbi:extracellular matrix protein 1-like [Osmerus eperlanus]|uniref:extracellular matrix protein 1-like n=1 Tax=Osmerus eperlanus TaxID=29151 RepID=UPI002E150B9B